MARFKPYDLNQTKMIPLSYADQVLEGSFEYTLNEIVEEQLDLSVFEHRHHNDATGRLAYDPKVLLKIVLYGYYRGIVSSRRIAKACCRNVMFMALSADSRPRFTTIASFVSNLERLHFELSGISGWLHRARVLPLRKSPGGDRRQLFLHLAYVVDVDQR